MDLSGFNDTVTTTTFKYTESNSFKQTVTTFKIYELVF